MIVGLGNPGQRYEATRHNAGAWFVELFAQTHNIKLQLETKFHSLVGRAQPNSTDCWLLIPTTYMNQSGLALKAFSTFYKIPPEAILVAHDELDFSPGIVKLKQDGGHGGHNGLRDIITHLHSKNFHRLRIGIGHPGHRDQVTDYVLSRPAKKEYECIVDAMTAANSVLPLFLAGDFQQATQLLHNRV